MPSQLAHCSYDDPMIIWNTLADVHSPCGCSTIITLHHHLHRTHLEWNEVMSTYIACAQHLAKLLSEAGHALSDDDLLLAIMAGLPHSYNPFLVSLNTLPDSAWWHHPLSHKWIHSTIIILYPLQPTSGSHWHWWCYGCDWWQLHLSSHLQNHVLQMWPERTLSE
jgi:hypothetical protein